MSLNEVQKDVDDWTGQFKLQYWKPHEILTRLAEEVGELAREINHEFGPKKKKEGEQPSAIDQEVCDIIFTLCCLSNSLKIDLDAAWKKNMDKHHGRDNARYEKK